MKIKTILPLLFLMFPLLIMAQEKQEVEKPVKYTMLLDGGISTGSPVSVCGEFSFMQGIKVNNKHLFALAFGIGGGFVLGYGDANWMSDLLYSPIYFNYRYFFAKQKRITPFISASLGELLSYCDDHQKPFAAADIEAGFYSSIAGGFQVGAFYIMGGINFTPMVSTVMERTANYYVTAYEKRWVFPIGMMLHIGLAF